MVSLDGSATACASWNASCKTRSVPVRSPLRGHKGRRPRASSSKRPAWPWPTWPSPPALPVFDSSTTPCKPYSRRLHVPSHSCEGRRDVAEASAAIQLRSRFANPYVRQLVRASRGHCGSRRRRGAGTDLSSDFAIGHGPGIVELTPTPDYINCRAVLSDMRDLTATIARSRWLLDLDADPVAIDRQLSIDQSLARSSPSHRDVEYLDALTEPRCATGRPGPTGFDHRGQTHAGRLVQRHGEPVSDPGGGLTHLFPLPTALRSVALAMPTKRRDTFAALVKALRSGDLELGPGGDRDDAMNVLSEIPGIGPWTRQVIAMRALGDPDAFPKPTSAFATRPNFSDSRHRPRRSWSALTSGDRGARTRCSTCGRSTTTASTTGRPGRDVYPAMKGNE